MIRVDELIMIIPVVLNLKGNLEMNLSARLGTAANLGHLDKPAHAALSFLATLRFSKYKRLLYHLSLLLLPLACLEYYLVRLRGQQ